MSDRKLAKSVQSLLRQIWRLHRSITKAFVTWLLRTALVVQRNRRYASAGFVLPTTVLLILVVALTTGALTYRAFNTSTRTIADTQSRVIYNAATPAVDRARSKIEFLFDANKDTRYPGGVPSEEFMTSMMLNGKPTIKVKGQTAGFLELDGGQNGGLGNTKDPYTLPGETRVDINGDNNPDNAWRYRADTNGDGTEDATVVYSIILSTPPDSGTKKGTDILIGMSDADKARGDIDASSGRRLSYVRSGPLSNKAATGGCATAATTGTRVEGGWYPDTGNSSVLRKNFQVDAFVVPDSVGTNGAANFTTLEFQQDRKLDRGNKWGAWFRNDMEIFPGPQFNWNGAIHTEGNLLIGGTSFSAYLISSPASCLFYESASEISVTNVQRTTDAGGNVTTPAFNGIIGAGRINDNAYAGSSLIYLHSPNPTTTKVTLGTGNDWTNGSATPFQVSSDPVAIQINDGRKSRAPDTTNATYFTKNNTFAGRFASRSEKAPYVDDTYRADNRYGPKPVYDASAAIPAGKRLGDVIQPTDNVSRDPDPAKVVDAGPKLIATDPAAGADSTTVGLDGYWERRARNQGLRILVGERLELGNSNGWVAPEDRPNTAAQDPRAAVVNGDGDYVDVRQRGAYGTNPADTSQADPDTSDDEGDPLYPPHGATGTTLSHEARQRRALRDNIAAVQGTAVYHAAVSRDYPVACLASTTHPGTPFTLRQSINFVPTFLTNSTPAGLPDSAGGITSAADTVLMTDFFNGRGTNGWEFDPPSQTQSQFETDMNNPTSPLRKALKNLAQFAGDHVSDTQTGAFPPTQELPGGLVHPYPNLTMWGNYSNLRRTLAQLESGTQYNDLSPADKTYLQTAACTTGILAYNIDRVQRFDPRNFNNDKVRPGQGQPIMQALSLDLFRLMDGIVDEANNNYEVLPKSQLATYNYDPTNNSPNTQNYNPRDYDRVPAEAFLGKLREYIIASSPTPSFNDPRLRTAELIFEYFQIRRDRTYGFRPSPAANTWNFNPFVTTSAPGPGTMLWSSACDPNIFALAVDSFSRTTGKTTADAYDPAVRYDVGVLRLALSRLCGTVIPAAAVRDFPGDIGLPQRYSGTNSAALDTSRALIPKTAPNDYLAYLPKAGTLFPDKAPTRQSPANFQSGVLAAAPFNDGVYLQATVAPKWPSLYYLFPEVDHDHDGGVERLTSSSGATVCLDHRQPDGALRHVDPTSCTDSSQPVMPAAFQPWAEPYIVDNYIRNTVNTTVRALYQRVDSLASPVFDANTYESYTSIPRTYVDANSGSMTFTYRVFNNPLSDLPVFNVALRPRKLPAGFTNPFPIQDNPTWQLPALVTNASGQVAGENNQYRPPNRILAPNGNNNQGVVAAIPFLDRVIFSGREWMPQRVMDIDLGMLRRTRPLTQGGANASPEAYPPDSASKSDVWLPVSGVVYAFREDSVREDAISRPPATAQASGTPPNPLPTTDVRNPNLPLDPPLQWIYSSSSDPKISVKAVDGVADPDRRPHGFRLRNGTQLARHSSMNIPSQDNIRGLSFFTDNPVFIMGNYNLHQNGTDDQDTGVTRLEEFTELLPDTGPYTEAQFYGRRTKDTRFADAAQDRWRPSEILADAISVVSDTLCDGSAIDTFMTAGQAGSGTTGLISETDFSGRQFTDSGQALPAGFLPYNRRYSSTGSGGVSVYDNRTAGMFGPGCTGASANTTFVNQNRPSTATLLTPGSTTSWSWVRENPFDIFSPVKISRNGSGLMVPPFPASPVTSTSASVYNPNPANYTGTAVSPASQPSKPRTTVAYTSNPVNGAFYGIANGRSKQDATDSRVNTIIVSGLVPSRQNQSYGGLHNFPRFLEDWNRLWFAGSFLQLNFSNYATSPFDQQVWEPGQNPVSGNEKIDYYAPPNRLWGYDVALQLAPAGPAAARFVTPSKERNEFYSEPPTNDPYIRNLCVSLPDTVIPDSRCPS